MRAEQSSSGRRLPEGDIEYATVSVYGEGVLFLENLRYRKGNEKKVAATVERVRGSVKDAENVLHNDTRFACLGNDDAVALFNHYELDRDRHTVKITFKDHMDYKIK